MLTTFFGFLYPGEAADVKICVVIQFKGKRGRDLTGVEYI